MNNNTKPRKVTLRPTQTNKVLRIAKERYEGNFSMALRVMVDRFEDGTCESCKHYKKDTDFEIEDGYCFHSMWNSSCEYNPAVQRDFRCNRWEKK